MNSLTDIHFFRTMRKIRTYFEYDKTLTSEEGNLIKNSSTPSEEIYNLIKILYKNNLMQQFALIVNIEKKLVNYHH